MAETTIATPLSGEDILDAVLFEVTRALRRDCHLNPALAYEAFSGEILIQLKLRDNGRVPEVEKAVRVSGGTPTGVASLYIEDATEVRLVLEERPPNVVRKEAGLGIPTLIEDASGKKDVKSVKFQTSQPTTERPPAPPPSEKPTEKPPGKTSPPPKPPEPDEAARRR